LEQGARTAALSSVLLLGSSAAARAQEDAVDTAVSTAIEVVKAAGGFLRGAVDVGITGAKLVQQGVEVAAPVVQQGLDVVTPVVKEAVRVGSDVASPAFKAAAPTFQAGISEANKFISNSGVDVSTINSTTATVVRTTQEGVLPKVSSFLSYLAVQEPVVLGEYALAATALYFLGPAALGAFGGYLRGFAGDVTAAAALDGLVNDGNTVLIDIRTGKDKELTGVPDVPSAGASKVIEVEFAATEDRKLRGQLRDAGSIEAQVTALQIAALKRVSKGSRILLLDRFGPIANAVARELGRKGYSKVFVVSGGFDGRGGWVQSKLQIKPSATAFATGTTFSNSITKTVSTRAFGKRALPAPKA